MKLPRKLVTLAAAVAIALTGAPAEAATPAFNMMSIWTNQGLTGSPHNLTWSTTMNCVGGQGYNWYAAPNPTTFQQEYYQQGWGQQMSSIYNRGSGPMCNRVWLKSGPWNGPENYLYTQCLPAGDYIAKFGFPYNDNVKQVGLSYDPACPR